MSRSGEVDDPSRSRARAPSSARGQRVGRQPITHSSGCRPRLLVVDAASPSPGLGWPEPVRRRTRCAGRSCSCRRVASTAPSSARTSLRSTATLGLGGHSVVQSHVALVGRLTSSIEIETVAMPSSSVVLLRQGRAHAESRARNVTAPESSPAPSMWRCSTVKANGVVRLPGRDTPSDPVSRLLPSGPWRGEQETLTAA